MIEELFDSLTIGTLYYFSDPIVARGNAHYFLCVHKTEDESTLLAVCTRSIDERRQLVEKNGEDLRTIVQIDHNGDNELRDPTYIDCNFPQYYSFEDLEDIYRHNRRNMPEAGTITQEELNNVISGILLSKQVVRHVRRSLGEVYPHLQ